MAWSSCDIHASYGISGRFQTLSRTVRQVAHALLTRPPLTQPRRASSVRLECVMHAASVHPEPGSNSQTNCISSAVAVRSLSELFILASFTFLKSFFLLVLTDFVFALAKFALYFFYLLFNCQVSIAHLFYVSLSIISPSNPFVNSFLKIFQNFFDRHRGVSGVSVLFRANSTIIPSFFILSIGF